MRLRINASVGKHAANIAKDVKIIQALMNVYLRSHGLTSLVIDGKCGDNTIENIKEFQKNEVKLLLPDGRIDAGGKSFKSMLTVYKKILNDRLTVIKPEVGLVTFDSEGMEGGPYHSRILHVPGQWSGLTVGRGYDMGMKSSAKITKDLNSVGINAKHVSVLSKAHGLKGSLAEKYIFENDLLDFQITPIIQKKLFDISYEEIAKDAKRVCTRKSDEMERYGECDWHNLDFRI